MITEVFGIEKENIILLDNSLISFTLCIDQGIPISDFNGEAGEEEDQELEFAGQYICKLFEENKETRFARINEDFEITKLYEQFVLKLN